MFTLNFCRLQLRPIDYSDADLVVEWRNSEDARDAFFSKTVVTPDTHMLFMANRKPHDLVWMIELNKEYTDSMRKPQPIGMVSLTVDVDKFRAEFGRLYLMKSFREDRFAEEIAYLVMHYGFEVLRLDSIWADVKEDNAAANKLYELVGFEMDYEESSKHEHAFIYNYSLARWNEYGWERFGALLNKIRTQQ